MIAKFIMLLKQQFVIIHVDFFSVKLLTIPTCKY